MNNSFKVFLNLCFFLGLFIVSLFFISSTAQAFDELTVDAGLLRYNHNNNFTYNFFDFPAIDGRDYYITVEVFSGNPNLYGDWSPNVSIATHNHSSTTNSFRDFILLEANRTADYNLAVYAAADAQIADYNIGVRSLPQLTSPADGALNLQLNNTTLRWSLAPNQDLNETYYLKIRDLSTDNVIYDRSINRSTSIEAQDLPLQNGRDYRWVIYYQESGCPSNECPSIPRTFHIAENTPPRLSNVSLNYENGAQYGTEFTWRVKYTDADSDFPVRRQIQIFNPRDGLSYTFDMISEGGDVRNGRYYRYTKRLVHVGEYRYRFIFDDGQGHEITTGDYNGPTTSPMDQAIRLSSGIFFQQPPIYAGRANNIFGLFEIRNDAAAPVQLRDLVLAIHEQVTGNFVSDLRLEHNIHMNSGERHDYDRADGNMIQPGSYQAIAKFRVEGTDQWFELDSDNLAQNYYDFEVLEDDQRPSVRFITDTAGVSWEAGSVQRIQWDSNDNVGVEHTALSLVQNGNVIFNSGDLGRSESYNLAIPDNLGGQDYYLRLYISDANGNDTVLDSPLFEIVGQDQRPPSVELLSPSAGDEVLQAGRLSEPATFNIQWDASDRDAQNQIRPVSYVRLELYFSNVFVGEIAQINNPQNNSYLWSVPERLNGELLGGIQYKIKAIVRDAAGNEAEDMSDAVFIIARLNITSPQIGEIWRLNENRGIRWNLQHIEQVDNVVISLSPDGGDAIPINREAANTGSYFWRVGQNTDNQLCNRCRINVRYDIQHEVGGPVYSLWNSTEFFTIADPEPAPPPPPGGEGDIESNYYLGADVLAALSDEPVNLATGNYYLFQTDIHIEGVGLHFHFERHYNSKDHREEVGPLGHRWTHSYHTYIDNPDSDDVVNIYLADGRLESYRMADDGSFVPQRWVYKTLIKNPDGSFDLSEKSGITYKYSSTGRLSSIEDRNGNRLLFEYLAGELSRVFDTMNRIYLFTYNDHNRLIEIEDPLGQSYLFSYDNQGLLASVTNPDGGEQSYTYDDNYQMLTLSNYRGDVITTNTYTNGRVTRQRDALNNEAIFEYDIDNRITHLTNPLGDTTTYHFDEELRTIRIDYPLNYNEIFTYDENSNRDSSQDKNGNVTRFTYDSFGNVLTRTDALGNVTRFTYNDFNQVTIKAAPNNTVTVFEYDQRGNLIRLTDPEGGVVTNVVNERGQISSSLDPRSNEIFYDYDLNTGKISQVTSAEGHVTQYTYDILGRHSQLIDARGNLTRYVYNSHHQIKTIFDPYGNRMTKDYDFDKNLIRETDKNNNQTTYTYDQKSQLTRVVNALGHEKNYTYDALGRLLTETDWNGNLTRYRYDALGNQIQKTDPRGNTTQYNYDGVRNLTRKVEPGNQITQYSYDDLHRLVTVTDALGNRLSHTYDAFGRLLTTTDKRGNTKNFTYNRLGKLLTVTDSLENTITYTYDENSNLITETDPLNHTTSYTYDDDNRKIRTEDASGASEEFSYDGVGNLRSYVDKRGNVWTYAYDRLNRKTSETDPRNGIYTTFYDANGNKIKTRDQGGFENNYLYDELNRLTLAEDALEQIKMYSYSANGKLLQMTDERGAITRYAYDANDNLIRVTDPMGNVTSYVYDPHNKLTQVLRPLNQSYAMSYDDLHRRRSLQNALGHTWTINYDENGNLLSQRDALGQTIRYTYDSENRLTRIDYPDKADAVMTYDARGLRTSLSDETGLTFFTYDALGRLTRKSKGEDYHISYSYDENSNITAVSGSHVNSTVYSYDTLNRPTFINHFNSPLNPSTFTFSYDSRSYLRQKFYPNGVRVEYLIDALGRLENLSYHKNQQQFLSYNYLYDAQGNLISESVEGGLPEAAWSPLDENYNYDRAGRLLSRGDFTYVYNANGQRTLSSRNNQVQAVYQYDSDSFLTAIDSDGILKEYLHDADGHLHEKVKGNSSEIFVQDTNGSLSQAIAKLDSNGNRIHQNIYSQGNLLGSEREAGLSYYYHDGQGNIAQLENENGQEEGAYRYLSFGEILAEDSVFENEYLYSGLFGVRAEEDGLYHMRDRFYDPEAGQFLSRDPVFGRRSSPETYNPYVYALNNPKMYVDPSGNLPEEVIESLRNNGCYHSSRNGRSSSDLSYSYILCDLKGVYRSGESNNKDFTLVIGLGTYGMVAGNSGQGNYGLASDSNAKVALLANYYLGGYATRLDTSSDIVLNQTDKSLIQATQKISINDYKKYKDFLIRNIKKLPKGVVGLEATYYDHTIDEIAANQDQAKSCDTHSAGYTLGGVYNSCSDGSKSLLVGFSSPILPLGKDERLKRTKVIYEFSAPEVFQDASNHRIESSKRLYEQGLLLPIDPSFNSYMPGFGF